MNQINQVRKINVNWKKSFVVPYGSLAIILLIYLLIYGSGDELIFVGSVFLAIVIAQYLFATQFEVTSFEVSEDKITVDFPLSLFLRRRIHTIDSIRCIDFQVNPGSKSVPRIFIIAKNGKRYKYYYSGFKQDTEILKEHMESHLVPINFI